MVVEALRTVYNHEMHFIALMPYVYAPAAGGSRSMYIDNFEMDGYVDTSLAPADIGYTLQFWLRRDSDDGDGTLAIDDVNATVFIDGSRAVTTVTGDRALIDTSSLTVGWHKVDILFRGVESTLRPIVVPPTLYLFNNQGYTYVTKPSLKKTIASSATGEHCYTYDYVYGDFDVQTAQEPYGTFHIDNKSQNILSVGSPALIRIQNAAINPSWKLIQGTEIVQSDGYFLDVEAWQTLEVSSYPQGQSTRLYEYDGTFENVFQLQDLTKSNFIMIPSGKSTLVFEGVTGAIEVSYREEYLLV
jgi:hypothetical protein